VIAVLRTVALPLQLTGTTGAVTCSLQLWGIVPNSCSLPCSASNSRRQLEPPCMAVHGPVLLLLERIASGLVLQTGRSNVSQLHASGLGQGCCTCVPEVLSSEYATNTQRDAVTGMQCPPAVESIKKSCTIASTKESHMIVSPQGGEQRWLDHQRTLGAPASSQPIRKRSGPCKLEGTPGRAASWGATAAV